MFRNKALRLMIWLLAGVLCMTAPAFASEDILYTQESDEPVRYQTEVVRRGVFERQVNAQASVYYPIGCEIFWEEDGAIFEEYGFSQGDAVKQGDVLVRYRVAADEIEIKRLELALERAKKDMQEGVRIRQEEIDRLRVSMSAEKDSWERQKLSIRLRKMQAELEQYKSRCLYDMAQQTKALEEARAGTAVCELRAPTDGVIGEQVYKKAGAQIKRGERLIYIYSEERVLLKVDNASGNFRFNMPVTVVSGSGAQRLELTGRVVGADSQAAEDAHTGSAYILLDDYDGGTRLRNLKVTASPVRLEDVLVVPQSAIRAENGRFYVNRLCDGQVQKRYVTVGMSGAGQAWLLGGVSEGDVLIVD